MILDVHTHVWPDRLARRALTANQLDLPLHGDGTMNGLLETMERSGIDRSVCLAVPNSPAHVEKANEFAGMLPSPLIGFGAIHPDIPPQDAVESLRRHGLCGVKVHPIYQGFDLDDRRVIEVLSALVGEFAVIVHCGGGHDQAGDRASPERLLAVTRALPDLDLIACHFGSYRDLDASEQLVVGTNVMLDTSWPPGLGHLSPDRVRRLIRRHGADRVIFGSDWPTADPQAEVNAVRALGLSDDETNAILGGNLQRLLDSGIGQ